jgi:hypothetical protein
MEVIPDPTPIMPDPVPSIEITVSVDDMDRAPSPWPPRPEYLANWPIPYRERWGRIANELQDRGIPWPDHERLAFVQVEMEMAQAVLLGG